MQKKSGRPSKFTQAIADGICERLSNSRYGLEEILEQMRLIDSNAPWPSTIYLWLRARASFSEQYSCARKQQAHYMADLAVKEAFTSRVGVIEKETVKGPEKTISDNVERSKLIVSALYKRASQLNPKEYGDKLQQEHSGSIGVTLLNDIPRPSRDG